MNLLPEFFFSQIFETRRILFTKLQNRKDEIYRTKSRCANCEQFAAVTLDFSRIICYCKWELSLLRMQMRVLSHFASHFWSLRQKCFNQTIVDVCRIESTDHEDQRHGRQWPVIHNNARKNIKNGKISNSPIAKTKLSISIYFSYFFAILILFLSHLYRKIFLKFAFNIYLWHSYMYYTHCRSYLPNVKPFLYWSLKKDSIIESNIKETWLLLFTFNAITHFDPNIATAANDREARARNEKLRETKDKKSQGDRAVNTTVEGWKLHRLSGRATGA